MPDQEQALVPVFAPVRSDGSDGRPPGSFIAGTGGSRKGLKNKLTAAIREEYQRYAEERGEQANPLLVLARIMIRDDVPPHVRVQAAGRLADFLIPKQFSMDNAPSEGVSEERIAATRSLYAQLFISESTRVPG